MNVQTVELGSWAKVAGLLPGTRTIVRFVPDNEVDYGAHKVPRNSLLGDALLGARAGDKVLLNPSYEPVELEVLAVGCA